ncbi:microfibril-associated glycoprotein 4-like [Sabethes cyaneus]|uniref:microfibril-associated glycoprotein 4-like n=1 Tax=Sabethes cyaneus TaxID=53552 RepID=UPI00237E70CB|nr:microfibril-associated glycoprotein 4-like [Sabethes cyaneus]
MATGSLLRNTVIVLVLLACLMLDQSKQEESTADLGFGLELLLAKFDELNLRILTLEQQNREILNKTMSCTKRPAKDRPQINPAKSNETSMSASGFEFDKLVVAEEFHENEVYRSCSEIPSGEEGKYLLRPTTEDGQPFYAVCNNTDGNGWMVIQHRFNGVENFYRNWTDYKHGFGSLDGEFWYGLDRIHLFTSSRKHEIMFELTDSTGKVATPKYNPFTVGSETEGYKLKELGPYTGTGSDSFEYHRGMKFSTYDRDNDQFASSCAETYQGAWWYKGCYYSNLNGKYKSGKVDVTSMCWNSFPRATVGLQRSKMMIREV